MENSFVVNNNGEITLQLPEFEELNYLHTDSIQRLESPSEEKSIYSALVLATRDYIQKKLF